MVNICEESQQTSELQLPGRISAIQLTLLRAFYSNFWFKDKGEDFEWSNDRVMIVLAWNWEMDIGGRLGSGQRQQASPHGRSPQDLCTCYSCYLDALLQGVPAASFTSASSLLGVFSWKIFDLRELPCCPTVHFLRHSFSLLYLRMCLTSRVACSLS